MDPHWIVRNICWTFILNTYKKRFIERNFPFFILSPFSVSATSKEEKIKIASSSNRFKKIPVKNTKTNRGACFLDSPPKIVPRRNSEYKAPNDVKIPEFNPEVKPKNGVRNWRNRKLTFGKVEDIDKITVQRTPEILKPCWLQRRSVKKSVRFNLPENNDHKAKPSKETLPKMEPIYQRVDTGFYLVKSILSWKPDWIKSNNPELCERKPPQSANLNFFSSHDEYRKSVSHVFDLN